MAYIAHVRKSDEKRQTLEEHLYEVELIAGDLAEKIGQREAGQLIGLLHDFGKYSKAFQDYLGSATGLIDPDGDGDYVDAKGLKGKIDHSSAGAQWIWQRFEKYGEQGKLCAQILSICIASHHSGLIDCLKVEGGNNFIRRMGKSDEKTHLQECLANASEELMQKATSLASRDLLVAMLQSLEKVSAQEQHNQTISKTIQYFYLGLWTRFLFSCLIDADRINSADFEQPENKQHRRQKSVDWQIAIDRVESFLDELKPEKPIDHIRQKISQQCLDRANDPQGIYTLTVPTGGGKTYASLRYALHHAKKHQLDRIIYVIPFTSIIDQNAQAIREVLECGKDVHPWVLEHHSNLEPENQTWHSKLTSENWDAPVVLTTMVQFLEVLFSGGTRSVRRMHQLANSLIIFDEIQTLPIKCVHLFCNALNFLVEHAHTSALLCTATQPVLDSLPKSEKGQLALPEKTELIGDNDEVKQLFDDLKRVNINNQVRPEAWSKEAIVDYAMRELNAFGSCLVIVNTKAWAQALYEMCVQEVDEESIYHLSTSMCPVHRKYMLDKIRRRLDAELPVLCISTQLIEAGVDIDFGSVIRFLAGLDSIAQAAGRCNRNGRLDVGQVTILNPEEENIDLLEDIKVGRNVTERILRDFAGDDLLNPKTMQQYFDYYFFQRADQMAYPIKQPRDDNLLNMLGCNKQNPAHDAETLMLQQSFMAASRTFNVIDAPTHAVIVPYQTKGKDIVAELCGMAKEFDPRRYYALLKEAQQYSVNLFPNIWRQLREIDAVHETQPGEGVYFLDVEYYSDEFGVCTEKVNTMPFQGC